MTDKDARGAINKLAKELGFRPSYWGDGDPILHTDDFNLKPVSYRAFSQLRSDFKLLLKYLNLELFEGREIRKVKSNR